jgi:DNA polymerase epsilon subunit 1
LQVGLVVEQGLLRLPGDFRLLLLLSFLSQQGFGGGLSGSGAAGGGAGALMALDEAAASAGAVSAGATASAAAGGDPLELLVDIREHDVSYYQRVSIDLDVRVGCWYSVTPISGRGEGNGLCKVVREKDIMLAAEPRVLAFDIETTKAPLMFPNSSFDQVYMVSYVLSDGMNPQGYLLINREIVGDDVPDFEYTPSKG